MKSLDGRLGIWHRHRLPTQQRYLALLLSLGRLHLCLRCRQKTSPILHRSVFFQVVAYRPPIVSVSFRLSPGIPKNTRDNILATKEYVVNLISEPFIEAANETSVEAPADVSEWDISGLTQEPSVHVKPARVKESPVSLECELFQSQDIFPDGATVPSATLVLGRVKYIHVRNSVLESDGLRADPAKLRTVSRLGGATYGRLCEGFDLKRPKWEEVRSILEAQRLS